MATHRRGSAAVAPERTAARAEASATSAAAAPTPAIGPVLLAVDDTSARDAAARLALDLAARRGAHVQLLSVVDTRPAPIPPPLDLALALADGAYGESIHAQRKRELLAAVSTTLGQPVEWPVEVKLGTPSHAIVDEAQRIEASLVVMGLRRHHALERALHDETTLNVMRTAPCPVVGVTPELAGLPRRVLAGVDFSRASVAAARAAKALVADDGALVLVYVAPPATMYLPDDGERVIHELGVAAAFKWLDHELGAAGRGTAIEHVVLQHEPGRSVCELLLGYAGQARADMIALGSMRHGRVERWMLGSVTTDLARDGSRSLLVVPPGEGAAPR
jgi:nucleotide-binding universal stress UspA family protein